MPAVFFGSSAHSIIEYNFLRGEPSISYFEILISVISYQSNTKAELVQVTKFQLFAWENLLIKKLEIQKTKPTFIISVLKVEY